MSLESARAFLTRVQADKAFREALQAGPEANARLLQEAGFQFSPSELESARAELSDAELECLSGGAIPGWSGGTAPVISYGHQHQFPSPVEPDSPDIPDFMGNS